MFCRINSTCSITCRLGVEARLKAAIAGVCDGQIVMHEWEIIQVRPGMVP